MTVDTGAIIKRVAEANSVPILDIMNSGKKTKNVVEARGEAIREMKKAGMTMPEIGVTLNISKWAVKHALVKDGQIYHERHDAFLELPKDVARIVMRAADRFGCPVEDVLINSVRSPSVTAARHSLIWDLGNKGLVTEHIAEILSVSTATVTNTIKRIAENGGNVEVKKRRDSNENVDADPRQVRIRRLSNIADNLTLPECQRIEARRQLLLEAGGSGDITSRSSLPMYSNGRGGYA